MGIQIEFNGKPLTIRIFIPEGPGEFCPNPSTLSPKNAVEVTELDSDLLQTMAQLIEGFGFIPAVDDMLMSNYGSGIALIKRRTLLAGGSRTDEFAAADTLRVNFDMIWQPYPLPISLP